MAAKQIYSIVNGLLGQSEGSVNIDVVDERGLIALGNTVLSSTTMKDNFLNSLVQRIGKTIIAERAYHSAYSSLLVTDFEWGNIVQKISFKLMEAEKDQSYDLTGTVDPFAINKPEVVQSLFSTSTPWQIHITIPDKLLKQAFTSESEMGSFIQGVFTNIQNTIEVGLENLGKTCVNNLIGEVYAGSNEERKVNLLALYNATTGNTLTIPQAMTSDEFLRFAVATINNTKKKMTSMNTIYNDGSVERHTPTEKQRLMVLSEFETALETIVQYKAIHDEYVQLKNFIDVPYWQSIKDVSHIDIKTASSGTLVNTPYIVGVLCDVDSCGIYRKDEQVGSIWNPAGSYTNTYYHMLEMYFNDLSEQAVVFYLEA